MTLQAWLHSVSQALRATALPAGRSPACQLDDVDLKRLARHTVFLVLGNVLTTVLSVLTTLDITALSLGTQVLVSGCTLVVMLAYRWVRDNSPPPVSSCGPPPKRV